MHVPFRSPRGGAKRQCGVAMHLPNPAPTKPPPGAHTYKIVGDLLLMLATRTVALADVDDAFAVVKNGLRVWRGDVGAVTDTTLSYDLRAIFGDDGGSELRMRVAMPALIGWRPLRSSIDRRAVLACVCV